MHRQGYVTASFILWLNCGVLGYVYCTSPGVQYPDGLFFGNGWEDNSGV